MMLGSQKKGWHVIERDADTMPSATPEGPIRSDGYAEPRATPGLYEAILSDDEGLPIRIRTCSSRMLLRIVPSTAGSLEVERS